MLGRSNGSWKFIGSGMDSASFFINEVDVWKHEWVAIPGGNAQVKDPLYGQDFTFDVWSIPSAPSVPRFAAGEFSNCMWGFYLESDAV